MTPGDLELSEALWELRRSLATLWPALALQYAPNHVLQAVAVLAFTTTSRNPLLRERCRALLS